jgi:hypothetical protein
MTERSGLPYRAYLVRCWQDEDDLSGDWRFSLEEVGAERPRQGFTSLQNLCGCLAVELYPDANKDGCRPD